jgi:integrase
LPPSTKCRRCSAACSAGDGIDCTTIWRNFKKAVDGAELTVEEQGRLSPYVLRHYYASLLISKGLNVVYISQQLGHADIDITLRTYAHLFDAADHAAQARDALDLAQTIIASSDERPGREHATTELA